MSFFRSEDKGIYYTSITEDASAHTTRESGRATSLNLARNVITAPLAEKWRGRLCIAAPL